MGSMKQAIFFLTISLLLGGCTGQRPSAEYAQQKSPQEEVANAHRQLPAASSSGELDVTISIRPEFEPDGRVRICGETNLPLGTELWINITEKSGSRTIGQARCSVTDDGRFCSELLGVASGLCRGLYVANVLMPGIRLQPPSVQQVLGANGERLSGPLVTRDALGATVRSSPCEFTFAGVSTGMAQEQTKAASEKARDAKAREEEAAQRPVEQKAALSKSPEETRAQIYDAFLESIRTCGNGTMFSEVATKDTMLVVVVTEEWNYAIYPARLEQARQMWRTWAALRSPNDMNSALLIMLDEYGNKVGGSRGLGSEIWVRRD